MSEVHDENVQQPESCEAQPKRAPKKRRSGKPSGAASRSLEAVIDLDMAIAYLQTTREELKQIDHGQRLSALERALIEPMSRVKLVQRFCGEVLRRYKWEQSDEDRDVGLG